MWPWIGMFLGGYLLLPLVRDLWAIDVSTREMTKWLENTPYHFIWRFYARHIDNNDNFFGASLLSWLVGACGTLVAFILAVINLKDGQVIYTPSLITTYGLGCATYAGLALSYNWLPAWFKKHWVKELTAYRNWQKNRNNNPIKQAQHYYRQLLKLIEGKEQEQPLEPVLKKFQQLINDELPRLLKRSKQLEKFIRQTEKAIARQKANGICPGEAEELKKAEADLDDFRDNKKEVANKIELILTIIDLAKAEVGRIIDAINAREEEQVHSLISQIQSELNLLTQTEAELSDLRRKYLNQEVQAQAAAVAEVQAAVNQVTVRDRPPRVAAR
ncbi:MAG: hypothetical protein NTZ49_02965 [Candidatus Parcubacteria bacterium]|nr:hypothetical protein [Candidatus Parcubacteria bacterium]